MKRSVGVGAAWVGSLLLAVAAGWWAAGRTLSAPADPLEPPPIVTYEVATGRIGQSVTLLGFAEWPARAAALNRAAGVVTSVSAAGPIELGEPLFHVDERPVVAGAGSVPAYRDLDSGSTGEDVRQLQALLNALGFGPLVEDGRFGGATRGAVKEWQRSLGLDDDGTVLAGDVVWLPRLPARYLLGAGLTVGSEVSGGEEILLVADRPRIWVPVSTAQRNRIPDSALLRAEFPSGERPGRIAAAVSSSNPDGADFDLVLEGPDGADICRPSCESDLPVGVRTEMRVEITLVPPLEGPVVPASAVVTRPDGSTYVTTTDGRQLPVSVLGSEGSLLLVDGVEAGEEIRVFGGEG